MHPYQPTGAPDQPSPAEISCFESDRYPELLTAFEPRGAAFRSSVAAVLRREPRPQVDAAFWPDVLIAGGLPNRGLVRSAVVHAVLIAALYGGSKLPRRQIEIVPPRIEHETLTYYRVEDQLPEMKAEAAPAAVSRAADPLPAAQAVTSLPPTPEKFRQRIIAPGKVKLTSEQRLPNIVAWRAPLPMPPEAGAEKLGPDINLSRAVIAPAPEDIDRALGVMSIEVRAAVPPPAKDVSRRLGDGLGSVQRAAVPPAPRDSAADLGGATLAVPRPVVIGPAPADMARLQNSLTLPERAAIPPPAHDAGRSRASDASGGTLAELAPGAIAPPPTAAAPSAGANIGSGQLLVVGVDPAEPNGAIEIPHGNLNGAFATDPKGKPGASGTPATIAGGNGPGGSGSKDDPSVGTGITILGPSITRNVPVVAGKSAAAEASRPEPITTPMNPNAFAMHYAGAGDLARAPASSSPHPDRSRAEEQLFSSRRSYAMAVNMPNLSSESGSWVIHFAEKSALANSPGLVPPEILMKADPAYPADLIKDGIQGTVTLYAVIGGDGSISNVRVLEGVDDRLNRFAEAALAESRFRPATRDGRGVEIEAVVQIPFRARPLQ